MSWDLLFKILVMKKFFLVMVISFLFCGNSSAADSLTDSEIEQNIQDLEDTVQAFSSTAESETQTKNK